MTWTDERLDDLANRMDAGFARTESDLRDVRTELKGDIEGLRAVQLRFGVAIMVCLIGVIGTLVGAIATGSMAG